MATVDVEVSDEALGILLQEAKRRELDLNTYLVSVFERVARELQKPL